MFWPKDDLGRALIFFLSEEGCHLFAQEEKRFTHQGFFCTVQEFEQKFSQSSWQRVVKILVLCFSSQQVHIQDISQLAFWERILFLFRKVLQSKQDGSCLGVGSSYNAMMQFVCSSSPLQPWFLAFQHVPGWTKIVNLSEEISFSFDRKGENIQVFLQEAVKKAPNFFIFHRLLIPFYIVKSIKTFFQFLSVALMMGGSLFLGKGMIASYLIRVKSDEINQAIQIYRKEYTQALERLHSRL